VVHGLAAREASRASFADLAATSVTKGVEESMRNSPIPSGKLLFTSGSTGMPGRHQHAGDGAPMRHDDVQVRRAIRTGRSRLKLDRCRGTHQRAAMRIHPILVRRRHARHRRRPADARQLGENGNLREAALTLRQRASGYAALAPPWQDDAVPQLFRTWLAVGGARLPDDLYDRSGVSVKPPASASCSIRLGSTDTADPTRRLGYRARRPDRPAPGVELKLRRGAKYECARAASTSRRGIQQPRFDQEDVHEEALLTRTLEVFIDDNDPLQGIIFAGRVVEDFKLTTGTLVHVGSHARMRFGRDTGGARRAAAGDRSSG
jgi:feruloyl-CoA synthase